MFQSSKIEDSLNANPKPFFVFLVFYQFYMNVPNLAQGDKLGVYRQ